MTPIEDFDEVEEHVLSRLNAMEDHAAASEDADLVFEIMALKARLGLPVTRPSTPPN
jgi:hypothetical protein